MGVGCVRRRSCREDLNSAGFQHYVKSRGGSAAVLTDPDSGKPLRVTTGKQKAPWLDWWIGMDWNDGCGTVFQNEIKNWSPHAIQGKTLSVPATTDPLVDYKESRWNQQHWDGGRQCLRQSYTSKVLSQMKLTAGVDEEDVRPLLIFREALGPRNQADDHLFSVEVEGDFSELWVFRFPATFGASLMPATGPWSCKCRNLLTELGCLTGCFPSRKVWPSSLLCIPVSHLAYDDKLRLIVIWRTPGPNPLRTLTN